jgi:two-component system, response regulator / RNA-binding antiterminator
MFGAAKLTDANLKILVIDESPDRAEILLSGLRDAGYTRVEHLREMMNLLPRIAAIEPDVILIDLENPNRDTVEQMFRVSREVKRPIAMFIDESDSETTIAAVKAGVSAYIIDGLRRERIKPIVEVAVSRFEAYCELEQRAVDAESKLSQRKSIDRAKAILMKKRGYDEQQAYDAIRHMARDKGKRMVEVAESLLTAEAMGLG